MTDTLIVQLIPPISGAGSGDDGQNPVNCAAQWLRLPGEETGGQASPETGELAVLLQQPPDDCEWIVLIPGEDVLTTAVKLPQKRRRQALKALPFMLEDGIASDVTLEHLAVGPDNAQAGTLVAITRKQQLRDLLQTFSAAGIAPSQLLPDYAMLKDSPDAWQILVNGGRAMARCPDGTGFSTPVSRLAMLLDATQGSETGGSLKSGQLIRSADTPSPAMPDGWKVNEQVVTGPLQHLAAEAHAAPLNLLQGEFRVVEQSSWNWRPWAAAAALAFIAIFISLLETGLETARLNRQSDQLQASIFDLAREALPDAKQIRDPQAQLFIAWRELGNAGVGGAEFLPLLDRVAATVSQQPVTVREIHFKDGTLTLALQGESLQQLDKLRQQIEQQGLSASLLNAGTDADSAHSNLVIKTASPQTSGSTG